MGLEYVEALVFHWPLALDQPVDAEEARAIRAEAWREAERFVDLGRRRCFDEASPTRVKGNLRLVRLP